jgi:hypothetical protein
MATRKSRGDPAQAFRYPIRPSQELQIASLLDGTRAQCMKSLAATRGPHGGEDAGSKLQALSKFPIPPAPLVAPSGTGIAACTRATAASCISQLGRKEWIVSPEIFRPTIFQPKRARIAQGKSLLVRRLRVFRGRPARRRLAHANSGPAFLAHHTLKVQPVPPCERGSNY